MSQPSQWEARCNLCNMHRIASVTIASIQLYMFGTIYIKTHHLIFISYFDDVANFAKKLY